MKNPKDFEALKRVAQNARTAAFQAVQHVALANYAGREQEATHLIRNAFDALADVIDLLATQPAPQPEAQALPPEWTPEMSRAVQLYSELGAYAASSLSGAYGLFEEFWNVAHRAAVSSPAPAPRTLLEQYDLDQSEDYRKGYHDGRLNGYEVGHRHGKEQAERAHGIDLDGGM